MLNRYLEILDNKIAETFYNMEQAEKKFREAKAAYDAVMREKENFSQEVAND